MPLDLERLPEDLRAFRKLCIAGTVSSQTLLQYRRIVARILKDTGTEEQVYGLINAAYDQGHLSISRAILIAYSCTMRPRDIPALRVIDVDFTNLVVWVERKGSIVSKVRHGKMEDRPILKQDAVRLLRVLVKQAKERTGKEDVADRRIFPGFSLTAVSGFVNKYAMDNGWDPNLMWDGLHSAARHASAHGTMRKCLDIVRASGSWSTADAALGYARQARNPPPAPSRKRTRGE